jgi:hypothetical protein
LHAIAQHSFAFHKPLYTTLQCKRLRTTQSPANATPTYPENRQKPGEPQCQRNNPTFGGAAQAPISNKRHVCRQKASLCDKNTAVPRRVQQAASTNLSGREHHFLWRWCPKGRTTNAPVSAILHCSLRHLQWRCDTFLVMRCKARAAGGKNR